MKTILFSLLMFTVAFNLNAETKILKTLKKSRSPAQEIIDMKNFDCANIKVQKVNFNFCKKDDGLLESFDVSEKTRTEKRKTITLIKNPDPKRYQGLTYRKYNDCSATIIEDGKSKTYYEVEPIIEYKEDPKTKHPVPVKYNICVPPARVTNYCDSPEDRVDVIGPNCIQYNGSGDDCSFIFKRAFEYGKRDINTAYADSRKECRCNNKGCGHIFETYSHPENKVYTADERLKKVAEIKAALKIATPYCDDIVVTDVSTEKSAIFTVAMSSMKCSLQYYRNPYNDIDCPAEFRAIRGAYINHGGKTLPLALVCLPVSQAKN